MGHAISHPSFDVSMDKKTIQRKCDEWANANIDHEEVGWGFHGLYNAINYTSHVFETYEDAEEYLNNLPAYNTTAVQYKIKKESSKTKTLKERVQKTRSELSELISANKFENYKSSKVGCKQCSSQLAVKYLRRPICPVCGGSLLSPTEQARINNKRDALEKAKAELSKSMKMDSDKNCKRRWMVHCEVHC